MKIIYHLSSLLSLWKFVGLLFECYVFLHMKCTKLKNIFQFWKQPSPSEKICLPVQVLLQSHNAVSKSWPCIHFCGPLYIPVLSINSAGRKSCRLHRDVDGGKGVVLLCCTRQNVVHCGAWWHTYSLHHFYLSYFLHVKKKNMFTTVPLPSY